MEIPIYVHGENDGVFNENDYILFYAKGPVSWKLDNGVFVRELNPYSDFSYVFMTADLGEGKRIQNAESVDGTADETVRHFLDYQHKEDDLYNLNNMGATWYGDKYDAVTSMSYAFKFPNLIKNKK